MAVVILDAQGVPIYEMPEPIVNARQLIDIPSMAALPDEALGVLLRKMLAELAHHVAQDMRELDGVVQISIHGGTR